MTKFLNHTRIKTVVGENGNYGKWEILGRITYYHSGRGQGRYASNQSFSEVSASGKFELLTDDRSGRCLSQHHHPKPGEVVYPEKCEKTRRYDTTYWRTW